MQVARLLVDDGRLCPAQRVRAVVVSAQADGCHPHVDQPSVLTGADVRGMVDPAREDEVVHCATATLQPREDAALSGIEELELRGPAGLLLDDDRSRANAIADDEVVDLHLHNVAASQLAVDGQVEYGRSRNRRSWSSRNRTARTCCGLSGRLAPSLRPAFQGRFLAPGSNSEYSTAALPWPTWPMKEQGVS